MFFFFLNELEYLPFYTFFERNKVTSKRTKDLVFVYINFCLLSRNSSN